MDTPPTSHDFLGSSNLTVSTISRAVTSLSDILKIGTSWISGSVSGSGVGGISLIISAGAKAKNLFRCSAINNGSWTSVLLIIRVFRFTSLFLDFNLIACLIIFHVFFRLLLLFFSSSSK